MKPLLVALMLLLAAPCAMADSATDSVRIVIHVLPGPDLYTDEHGRWVPAAECGNNGDARLVVTFGEGKAVYDDGKEGE